MISASRGRQEGIGLQGGPHDNIAWVPVVSEYWDIAIKYGDRGMGAQEYLVGEVGSGGVTAALFAQISQPKTKITTTNQWLLTKSTIDPSQTTDTTTIKFSIEFKLEITASLNFNFDGRCTIANPG